MAESKDKQKTGGKDVPHASGTDAAPIGATSDEVQIATNGPDADTLHKSLFIGVLRRSETLIFLITKFIFIPRSGPQNIGTRHAKKQNWIVSFRWIGVKVRRQTKSGTRP